MKSTTPRICPQCGATNTGRSLFCAECGAALNQPPDPTMTHPLTGGTHTEPPAGSDQRTEAYAPAWEQPWSGKEHEPAASAAPPRGGGIGTAVHTPVDSPAPGTDSPVLINAVPPASSRGFYLGLVAILIIVAIALALGWLALVQPNL